MAEQMTQPQGGLAAQGTPAGGTGMEQMLQQVVELLLQDTDPEELVQQGVPPEVIMAAIEIIEQEMAAQQGQPAAPAPTGLAGLGM